MFLLSYSVSLALVLDEKDRRIAVMLYLVTRALQSVHLHLFNKGVVPEIPHGETILMGILNVQIIYAFMCQPSTLAVRILIFIIE
jgi:hypothetical protein